MIDHGWLTYARDDRRRRIVSIRTRGSINLDGALQDYIITHTTALDDEALRELIPMLRRFALWLARDVHAADDLVQSTLERALSRWTSRRDDASLRSWLFTILYRQFLQKDLIDQRKDRTIGSNAQSERDHGHGGKSRPPRQRPQANTKVLKEVV